MASPRPRGAKIVSVEELAALVNVARRAGRTVVQAHGTFDLLHLGHVRHLEAARRHADVLVVTVTADAFVKKGPGRPVFPDRLRAEMLAALAVVNHVAVDHHADAVAAIRWIRPHVYAKGQDYADAAADVTGKIAEERAAVEAGGGAVVFTDEVSFSSSALVNRHLDVHEPRLRAHLERLRGGGAREAMLAALDRIRASSVLVVGDAILDEYQHVAPLGKAGKESLVAQRLLDTETYAGGALATANHLASFCAHVELVTCLGDAEDEAFARAGLRPNVTLTALTRAPTTRKRRFVERGALRKLFEVYVIDDEPLAPPLQRALEETLARRVGDADLVVANDFGHGLIGPSTVGLLAETARFLAVNTQCNAANHGENLVHRYPRADLVCLDAEEARLAVADRRSPLDEVVRVKLPARVRCDRFVVTRGGDGCLTHRRGEEVHDVPAVTRSAVDTLGAGDAFLAVASPLCAAGLALDLCGFIGNVAGALKCDIVGHRRPIERVDVVKAVKALLQ